MQVAYCLDPQTLEVLLAVPAPNSEQMCKLVLITNPTSQANGEFITSLYNLPHMHLIYV